jgi:hypothetical protein
VELKADIDVGQKVHEGVGSCPSQQVAGNNGALFRASRGWDQRKEMSRTTTMRGVEILLTDINMKENFGNNAAE